MFGKKKKLIRVKLSEFGPSALNFDKGEWVFDTSEGTFTLTINAQVIDCDNGGTCETTEDGGFTIELIPID